jgi:hypothetical protein
MANLAHRGAECLMRPGRKQLIMACSVLGMGGAAFAPEDPLKPKLGA